MLLLLEKFPPGSVQEWGFPFWPHPFSWFPSHHLLFQVLQARRWVGVHTEPHNECPSLCSHLTPPTLTHFKDTGAFTLLVRVQLPLPVPQAWFCLVFGRGKSGFASALWALSLNSQVLYVFLVSADWGACDYQWESRMKGKHIDWLLEIWPCLLSYQLWDRNEDRKG